MVSVSRARAENRKKKLKAVDEQEKSERDKTARLKALRLAKEAEDQADKSTE